MKVGQTLLWQAHPYALALGFVVARSRCSFIYILFYLFLFYCLSYMRFARFSNE